MRQLVIIVLLLSISLPVFSQYRYHHPDAFFYPSMVPSENSNGSDESGESPWVKYSLSSGVIFNSLSGYNRVSTFVSPKVFIPAGKRFSVELGTTFISTRFPGENDGVDFVSNSLITHATGIFSLNEKTIIYGEVAKSFSTNNPFSDKGFERYTFGMEYFITPSFRIGASITSINGSLPGFYSSPYNNGYGRSVWNPFY